MEIISVLLPIHDQQLHRWTDFVQIQHAGLSLEAATHIDQYYHLVHIYPDRLCGLVVRVPGYRSRGAGFDFWHYQIFWEVVGLEWSSLSLASITEELLGWKSSVSRSRELRLTAVGNHCAENMTLTSRQAAIARSV
jgi:hypothetical protein